MGVEQGKPADILRLIPSRLACPVKSDARLYFWRQACLAHQPELGLNAPIVPIVIRMFVFLALGDHFSIVNYALVRMGDKILDRGIEGSCVFQILLDAAQIKIDKNEGREPGLFGTIQHPEAGGLAARKIAETLKRRPP